MNVQFNILEGFEWASPPRPSRDELPSWWRDMKPSIPQEEIDESQIFPSGTAKVCMPFEDALSAGYVLPLPFQVYAECDAKGETTMRWNPPPHHEWTLISTHSKSQLDGPKMGLDEGGIFKFMLPFSVKLPEGYAALYTHPLNRHDLPFQTFSGIVDAGYESPVNIPFMWIAPESKCFLDAGTPVAQLIPFKVEDWTHSLQSKPLGDIMKSSREAAAFVRGYRRKFGKKKIYS